MDNIGAKAEELMKAYSQVFGSPAGQIVLADLELYCFGIESVAVPGNADRTFMNEGRREVLLRIGKFQNCSLKDLYNLHLGKTAVLRDENGDKIDG